ncbi:MAG: 4Fe-4S binding protein [Promethearchaeota archaeon]
MSKAKSDRVWRRLAGAVVRAGAIPFPVTDALLEFLKRKVTFEQAEFLKIFRDISLNWKQVLERSGLPEEEARKHLEALLANGVLTRTKSRTTGVEVFSLMPLFPGMIEFSLMAGRASEEERRLASIIERIFADLRDGTQRNYDTFMPAVKQYPVPARVVPVEAQLDVGVDEVVPPESLPEILEGQEVVALTHCYCRMQRDLTGKPCAFTDAREICLIFGKVAQHAIDYGFAKPITKERALAILRASEEDGLVHKIFHTKLDLSRDVEGICSCCRDCCGIFRLFHEGALPYHSVTSYESSVDAEACVGCGECVERCPMDALNLDGDAGVAVVQRERCIGCGVCTRACPQDPPAISLVRTGRREVFVLPPRLGGKGKDAAS